MSKYNYHLTGQNSDFAKIMARITHYQPHIMMMSEMSHENKKVLTGPMNHNTLPPNPPEGFDHVQNCWS